MSFKLLIQELERLQREGQEPLVREKLAKITPSKIQRHEALPLANLARRINMIQFAMRILNPIVRQKNQHVEPATAEEKIEYAILLYKIGASNEAHGVLKTVDFEKNPSGYLSQAFVLFSEWKYAESIPILRKYIEHSQLTDYAKLVGRINLASALLYCGSYHEALEQLDVVLRVAREKDYKLLQANCLEISSQVAFQKKEHTQALQLINDAEKTLSQNQDLNTFYIEKVKILLKAQQMPRPQARQTLLQLKSKAERLKHWETAREADFYSSLYSQNKELFEYVYWGTPHQSYLEKMLKAWGEPIEIKSNYNWILKAGKESEILDLTHLQSFGERREKDLTILINNLLLHLTSDFYRSFSVGQLHSVLYTNQYFDPFSSPTKIYQVVKRLRQWFKEQRLPLQVLHNNGYKLSANRAIEIVLPFSRIVKEQDPQMQTLSEIYAFFADQPFSTKQAVTAMKLSKSTINTVLSWAVERGLLVRTGQTRRVRYQFKQEFKNQLAA